MSISDLFAAMPQQWLVDVEIRRSGGRDKWGNPLPEESLTAHSCLVGWRATAEPVDFSEVAEAQATLYQQDEDGIDWRSGDRVVIPGSGDQPSGTWAVDGEPKHWAIGGWEVALRRDNG